MKGKATTVIYHQAILNICFVTLKWKVPIYKPFHINTDHSRQFWLFELEDLSSAFRRKPRIVLLIRRTGQNSPKLSITISTLSKYSYVNKIFFFSWLHLFLFPIFPFSQTNFHFTSNWWTFWRTNCLIGGFGGENIKRHNSVFGGQNGKLEEK